MKTTVESLKIGDVILPPARELSLWMRRECARRNQPESALYLTITDIHEGAPDKGGRWIVVKGDQTPEWNEPVLKAGNKPSPFTFRARPTSPWLKIA